MSEIAAGFLIKSKDQYLLGKAFGFKEPRAWTIFKGCQEIGESLLETAIRELYEESNINIVPNLIKYITPKPIYHYVLKNSKKDVYVFLLNDIDGILQNYTFKCNSFFDQTKPEILRYKWFTKDEFKYHIFESQKGLIKILDSF